MAHTVTIAGAILARPVGLPNREVPFHIFARGQPKTQPDAWDLSAYARQSEAADSHCIQLQ